MACGWALRDPDGSPARTELDGDVSELGLAEVVDRYELEPMTASAPSYSHRPGTLPFPPELRLAPAVLVTLDLDLSETVTARYASTWTGWIPTPSGAVCHFSRAQAGCARGRTGHETRVGRGW